jgi:nucleotide-binding universal stress UspA family protein
MRKILVTTDLSNNSKAGVRFAISLASQGHFDLTFLHVYSTLVPTGWSNSKKISYQNEVSNKTQLTLETFVDRMYKKMNFTNKKIKCVIESSGLTDPAIIEYASRNQFDFICCSTRGAGKFERFFGTNTANLILNSKVPVIAIPHNHRTKTIKNILYASDVVNLQLELKKVITLAKLLNAKVELLHFLNPLESVDSGNIKTSVKKFTKYKVQMSIKTRDPINTLIADIEDAIKSTKPSLLIMFTDLNRSIFQRIFLSGKAAEYAYNPKVPLLVFNKSK